jgi:hypothetical protein
MDVHIATDKINTFKDVLVRYLLIVAGTLTALALGQWVEARRHHEQGAQALVTVEAEVQRNIRVLTGSVENNKKMLDKVLTIEHQLGKDSFATPGLEARAQALLKGAESDITLGMNLAALQHSAWDAAVASQALAFINKDRAVFLARAYAMQHEVSNNARQSISSVVNVGKLAVVDAYSRGESKDALAFARALREYRMEMQGANAQYAALLDFLRESTKAAQALSPAASASARR